MLLQYISGRASVVRMSSGLAGLLAVLLPVSALAVGPEAASERVHEDWRVVCRDTTCILESTIVAEDRTWLATVRAKPADDGADLQILVPAGVHLASGLFVGTAGGRAKQASFIRCAEAACEAHLALDAGELTGWKRGRAAELRYRPTVSVKPVAFELSLMGITAAFADAEGRG